MKNLIVAMTAIITLGSCHAFNKLPCGNPKQVQHWHEKKKFKVQRIKKMDGYYLVRLQGIETSVNLKYECLPDSIVIGKTVML